MKARFLDEATAEFHEAIDWYDQQRDGLGKDFHDAVDEAIRRVLAAPEQFPIYEGSPTPRRFHRVVLKRFSFYIAFVVRPEELLVVAISHTSRRPDYWRNRGE